MKRRVAALTVLLSATSAVQAQEAPLTDLIESLYKRGVIEQEEYDRYQESKKEERARSRVERRERAMRDALDKERLAKLEAKKSWTDKIDFRGYIQIRDSMVVGGDDDIRLWNDRGVGPNTGLFIRRARLIFSGQVSDNLYIYVQPDLASSAGDTGNVAQLRDAYGDISFDDKREYRIRVGQSKIPYSFENLQSSQNRLSLDRNDALNSCCRDERDIGAFFYWAPADKRAMFSDLTRLGLKGSGDYGVIAFGTYNGQGANRAERNNNMHMVARFTWPFKTANDQYYEYGIQAITGQFSPITSGTVRSSGDYKDQRVGLHGIVYPQPWGIQAEWNWGQGPELNQRTNRIESGSLSGGYVQVMYRKEDFFGYGVLTPFVKYQNYQGGMKFQTNAPSTSVNDWEFGAEWQPRKEIELTLVWQRYNRNDVTRSPYAYFKSDVLRAQLQYSF
jgi:hypothetical protein